MEGSIALLGVAGCIIRIFIYIALVYLRGNTKYPWQWCVGIGGVGGVWGLGVLVVCGDWGVCVVLM